MRRRATLVTIAMLALTASAALKPGRAAAAEGLRIAVIARVSGKFVSPAGAETPGFDVELLRHFAAWYKVRTGKDAELVFAYAPTVPELLDAVRKGTADIGVGGVTATAERTRVVEFTLPTLPVRSVLVAPPGVLDPKRWHEQLKGLRLGATVGSTNAAEVERQAAAIGGVKANTGYQTNEAVFAALGGTARSLDAAIVDLPQYWTTGKQIGLVLVDSLGEPQNMAFVVAKGSSLKGRIDPFLDGYTHSNEYFQLIRRYFGQDAEEMVRLSRGGS